MAENDKYADEKLTKEQLDGVAGGFSWIPNKLNPKAYEVAGIKVVGNVFSSDEFWYKGENIGHYKATAVALYFAYNKRLPGKVGDATWWYENDYKSPKKSISVATSSGFVAT